jgi:hypothetical protein
MIEITTKKDEFTGLRTINTNFFGIKDVLTFGGPTEIYLDFLTKQNSGIKSEVIDAIDLMYIEGENGQGNLCIRVVSAIGKYLRNLEWPHWDQNWLLIIDGERVSLNSSTINSFETSYELKVYDLPIDVFYKICNAKEIKYSLRGRNSKVEGVFLEKHLEIFKTFEKYCFGNENEAKLELAELNKTIKGNNQINISGKANELSKEEVENLEAEMVKFLKANKVEEAIKFYSDSYNYDHTSSNTKSYVTNELKKIAEKHGLEDVIKKHERKSTILGFIVIAVVLFILFKACS